jgi:hypothetical protein
MALTYSTHTSLARHVLPISFRTSISLVFFLFCLQFLYAISFILSPFWPLKYGPRPFKNAIKRTETRVIDLIVEILPPPIYRSPVPSSAFLHEDAFSRRSTNAHSASHLGFYRVRSALPRVVDLAELPQVYRPGAVGRSLSPSMHHENQRPATDVVQIASVSTNHGTHNYPDFSYYDGMSNTALPSTSCPNIALAGNGNHHGLIAPPPTPVPQLQQEEQRRIVQIVHGVPIEEAVEPNPVEKIQPTPCINPRINSPTVSTGEAQISLAVIIPAALRSSSQRYSSSHYTENNLTDLSLESNRTNKTHSTQTYPPKFPVSEYSSLVADLSSFREKGTTHVRPFSDY